jgi:hypothetical protein
LPDPSSPAAAPLPDDVAQLVERIHATSTLAVVAVSGAGSQALAWLLGVGGASRTLLEATVPYAQRAMIEYLGFEPAEYASAEAAAGLASSARRRAQVLMRGLDGVEVLGLGCAAAIATDRRKRGEHRAYVALEATEGGRCWGVILEKGARDRTAEEALVSRLLINVLAEGCGLEGNLDLGLRPGERIEVSERAT